jgi:hypothetical protein
MADILTILQNFLCYGNSDCINLFNQYAFKPMEGLFYVVFFPILFIILFIFILSSSVSPNRGFRALLSIGVFAFIILQGWYYFFAMIGELWLYLLIFLGFIWILVHTFVGRSSGGEGGAKARSGGGTFSGVLGDAGKRLKVQMSSELSDHQKRLEALLHSLKGLIGDMRKAGSQSDIDNVYRAYVELLPQIDSHLESLRQMTAIKGFKVGGKFNELLKRYKNLTAEMDKMHMKRGGKAAESAAA